MLFQSITILSLLLALVSGQGAPKLLQYKIRDGETSVSGISSGGYFATQMQVAYSSIIKGAGIIAAGHYNCGAEKYLAYCMGASWPFTNQVAQTKTWSGVRIDSVDNLKKQKVYMISGTKDFVVTQTNVDQLYDYYKSFIPAENIVYKKDLPSAHTFPTDFDSQGNNDCGSSADPYISNCGFDGAGAILKHIYGDLKNRTTKPTGEYVAFDQSEFHANPNSIGLDNTGYVYVPTACKTKKCSLHVAFHGCKQSSEQIGVKFIRATGYDRWADKNRIIVLFPQAHSDSAIHSTNKNGLLNNLNACWDWIGWYDTFFSTRDGVQTSTVKKMIDRIMGKL